MDKQIAKCYGVWSDRYYRTESGETFCIKDEKHYFYFGNIKTGENLGCKYLSKSEIKRLKTSVEFVD